MFCFGKVPVWVVTIFCCLCLVRPVYARNISVPVRFDLDLIKQQFLADVNAAPDGTAVILDDKEACQRLALSNIRLSTVSGKLCITARMEALAGIPLNDQCITGQPTYHIIEILQEPYFDNATRSIVLHTVNLTLYDETGSINLSHGPLWNVVKEPLYRRIGNIRISFQPLIENLRSLLEQSLPWQQQVISTTLDSLHFSRPVLAQDALLLHVSFSVPEQEQYSPHLPEPALSDAEIAAFRTRLEQLDAFLTFAIKQFARTSDAALQHALVEVLLDARYAIVEALGLPPSVKEDPVKQLFLRTWERLAPLVRAVYRQAPSQNGFAYLGFITAVDALAALDRAGPDLGIEISADGLRRLARMLDATAPDPLFYSLELDPELRALLGFGPPLPPPEIPQDSPVSVPQAYLPFSLPCLLQTLAAFLWDACSEGFASSAHAENLPNELKRLNSWVPSAQDVSDYLLLIQRLLHDAATKTLGSNKLPDRFHQIYTHIVLAAAWQESCWRHFIRNGDTITVLTSSAGSVGIMQINAKVWRGVYDIKGIYADIAYNARAGCEILLHYLKDYAIQKSEESYPGGIDNLARATYAAYNGGPAHLSRYRQATTSTSLQQIDNLFLGKYTAVKEGRLHEIAGCYN